MRIGIAILLGAVASLVLLLAAEGPRPVLAEHPVQVPRWEYRLATLEELLGLSPAEQIGSAMELGLASFALAFGPAEEQADVQREARRKLDGWNERVQRAFDGAGRDGWELVQVVDQTLYFKRPLTAAEAAPEHGAPESSKSSPE